MTSFSFALVPASHMYILFKKGREKGYFASRPEIRHAAGLKIPFRVVYAGDRPRKKKEKREIAGFPFPGKFEYSHCDVITLSGKYDEYPPQPFLPRKMTCRLFVVESQIVIGITSPIAFLFLFRSSPLIAGAAAAGPCANCCCRLIRK
jgi:hypothetical protein